MGTSEWTFSRRRWSWRLSSECVLWLDTKSPGTVRGALRNSGVSAIQGLKCTVVNENAISSREKRPLERGVRIQRFRIAGLHCSISILLVVCKCKKF